MDVLSIIHERTTSIRTAMVFIVLCCPWLAQAQEPITIQGRQFDNVEALHDFLTVGRTAEAGAERYQEEQLKAAALLAYAKLDPKGAREIALVEMANSSPDISVSGLLFLQDSEIPELTDAFRANLKTDTFYWHLACIERYGSSDLLPDVVELYERHKGTWACDIAQHGLGFIVKHDRERGLQLVEEAVSFRAKTQTGCYHDVMRGVLVAYPGPDVLALSLKYIGDPDEAVATSAAYVASKQDGGKSELRAIMRLEPDRLSASTRKYIETQLLAEP